ncbi:MAG: hypothetical protein K2X27_06310 [Candidatus Obscuribacterales bacterium]|nr:hypothetical protein [Candidatus Obscuribacterales bacterium]
MNEISSNIPSDWYPDIKQQRASDLRELKSLTDQAFIQSEKTLLQEMLSQTTDAQAISANKFLLDIKAQSSLEQNLLIATSIGIGILILSCFL